MLEELSRFGNRFMAEQNEFLITEFLYQCVTVKAFEGIKVNHTIHYSLPQNKSFGGKGTKGRK